MSEKKYLDAFVDTLDTNNYEMDKALKQKILKKSLRKINRKKHTISIMIAACFTLLIVLPFIPNTPVYALWQNVFSFIPGIGVVQEDENTGNIVSVLKKPVMVTKGDIFVEIRTAFTTSNGLHVSGRTNVGTPDVSKVKDIQEHKKLLAFVAGETGETHGKIFLLNDGDSIQAHLVGRAGPSMEGVYTIDASFALPDGAKHNTFYLEFEGFEAIIEIPMSSTTSSIMPSEMGNVVQIEENVLIFADIYREGDLVEVLTSIVAPREYFDPRLYLFEFEKTLFETDVHLLDQYGNIYVPDNELRKQNKKSIHTFYFHVPQEKEDLKLVIPQLLYTSNRTSNDIEIKMNMPQLDKDIDIDKAFMLGDMSILIQKASIVPADDESLTNEHFKGYDVLKINTQAIATKETNQMICRIIANVQIPDSWTKWRGISQAVSTDLWRPEQQSGYSLVMIDDLLDIRKMLLTFDVEFALIGPWDIALEE